MNEIKKRNYLNEKTILLGIIIFIFPVLIYFSGTITSGWHFADDHETVRIAQLNVQKGVSFFATLKQYLLYDISSRWRPLYWFFRVLSAYIFEMNSVIPNILLCLLGTVTYTLLYYTAKNCSCDILNSHLFALLITIGRQYEVWFRIANQENIGLFLLALCTWIITSQYSKKAYENRIYDFCLGFFSICCALMKESFLLLLPGVILFRLYLEGICKLDSWKKFPQLLKRHIILCASTAIVFLGSLYAIVNYVGTNSIGYAGIDTDYGIKGVIWNIMKMLKNSLFHYVILFIMILVLFLFAIVKGSSRNKSKLILIGYSLFGIYIMFAEMVLYAKSDMWDRYLIPFCVGYGVVTIVVISQFVTGKVVRIVYTLIISAFLVTRFSLAICNMAIPYGIEGRAIQSMLGSVLELTDEDSEIITALDAGEENLAVSIYLELAGRKNVYVYEKDKTEWVDGYGSDATVLSAYDYDLYILDTDEENHEISKHIAQNSEAWQKMMIDNEFILWINKEAIY